MNLLPITLAALTIIGLIALAYLSFADNNK
jgi:hypothetical protein